MLSCCLVVMWPCFEVGQWFGQITSSCLTSLLAQGLMVGYLMYCCRVLARRAGNSGAIALVLINIIPRDCLRIGGRGRWMEIVVYGYVSGVVVVVFCCWECACVG
jgi:hypothetical protein